MNDYINRNDALDTVAHNNVHGEITLNRYDKIIGGIYEIPSADVAPVRHGRWEKKYGYYKCLLCNCLDDFADNYCPNCGAKMDEEAES